MSIMLENNIVSGGFLHRSNNNKMMPSILGTKDRGLMKKAVLEERENGGSVLDPCTTSSSSSSIGMNSDDEDGEIVNGNRISNFNEEQEVESKLQSSPFDSAVDALEQALPMRRGISKFYNGKSKSFASLGDAACSSIKDITKQENAYTRKRKNLLAFSLLCDKGRTSLLKSPSIGGGIAKRSTGSSRNSLALAVAMNNCDSRADEYNSSTEENRKNNLRSPSISPPLTPVPPPPWRSFSLADLQHCAVSASAINSNLPFPLMGKRTKPDQVS